MFETDETGLTKNRKCCHKPAQWNWQNDHPQTCSLHWRAVVLLLNFVSNKRNLISHNTICTDLFRAATVLQVFNHWLLYQWNECWSPWKAVDSVDELGSRISQIIWVLRSNWFSKWSATLSWPLRISEIAYIRYWKACFRSNTPKPSARIIEQRWINTFLYSLAPFWETLPPGRLRPHHAYVWDQCDPSTAKVIAFLPQSQKIFFGWLLNLAQKTSAQYNLDSSIHTADNVS